jgi:hypothetical protein
MQLAEWLIAVHVKPGITWPHHNIHQIYVDISRCVIGPMRPATRKSTHLTRHETWDIRSRPSIQQCCTQHYASPQKVVWNAEPTLTLQVQLRHAHITWLDLGVYPCPLFWLVMLPPVRHTGGRAIPKPLVFLVRQTGEGNFPYTFIPFVSLISKGVWGSPFH